MLQSSSEVQTSIRWRCVRALHPVLRDGHGLGVWNLVLGISASSPSPRTQFLRQSDRGKHARWIRDIFARDVIGRAVIGGRANEGQTQRPIHAGVEADHLQRNESLVV